jgi:hypothetical protein
MSFRMGRPPDPSRGEKGKRGRGEKEKRGKGEKEKRGGWVGTLER